MFKVTVKAMVKEAINDTAKEMDKITLAMPQAAATDKPTTRVIIPVKAMVKTTQEAPMAKAGTAYKVKPQAMKKMNGQYMTQSILMMIYLVSTLI